MEGGTRDVVVVGGGVSGLTLAWHLKRAGVDVCLLEAEVQVGGCTRSEVRDGFLLEKGPFNVIVRDRAFEGLLDGLSDRVKVVTADKSARKRYIYRHGRLHLVPTNPVSLLTTGLLSFGGRLRLMSGMLWSRRGGDREETIEQVAIRRFGRDVSDTMISAVMAGIFAGRHSQAEPAGLLLVRGGRGPRGAQPDRIRPVEGLLPQEEAQAALPRAGEHRRRTRRADRRDGRDPGRRPADRDARDVHARGRTAALR